MDQSSAVLVAAILASVGWYITNRVNHNLARRRHTFEMFQSYRTKPEHTDAIHKLRLMVKKGTIPDHIDIEHDETRREDYESVLYLINHYEFIAAAIYNGDLDENFVRSFEYSRIVRLVTLCRKFIDSYRNDRRQTTMAENLDHLVDRWRDENPTNRAGIYEIFMLKPYRNWKSAATK